MPTFSIIVPHYDQAISDQLFVRGMDSLQSQTCGDFEIILLHDGPISRPLPIKAEYNKIAEVIITETRFNDWGHSLRDIGMKKASGEFIVHFNPDNVLYPNALDELQKCLHEPVDPAVPKEFLDDGNIAIFYILMRGMQTDGRVAYRDFRHPERFTLLTGYPVVRRYIDCMQLVMRRSLWLEYGGWYDKSEVSDGEMYARFVAEHGARYISKVLGEHW